MSLTAFVPRWASIVATKELAATTTRGFPGDCGPGVSRASKDRLSRRKKWHAKIIKEKKEAILITYISSSSS